MAGGGGLDAHDHQSGAGGGAGGYRASGFWTISPLQGSALDLDIGCFCITVGGGGNGEQTQTARALKTDQDSVFPGITSAGGGRGATS